MVWRPRNRQVKEKQSIDKFVSWKNLRKYMFGPGIVYNQGEYLGYLGYLSFPVVMFSPYNILHRKPSYTAV